MPKKKPSHTRKQSLRAVCDRIGYQFEDLELLDRALSHSSLGNEGVANYERLEFLGDAILGFLVAEILYRSTPEILEGELTSRRALMVSRQPLCTVAEDLRLADDLSVGRGLTDESLRSPRILADLTEAVLGAIYVDGGIQPARLFVKEFVVDRFGGDQARVRPTTDPKTRLNQWAQSHDLDTPAYRIAATTGPDHDPTFIVSVTVDGITTTSVEVKNKQTGEQDAAAKAQALLEKRANLEVEGAMAEGDGESEDDSIRVVWDEPD